VPFAFLVMGSAGREEQTLATDQDNAILFRDVEPDKLQEVQAWFLRLGSLVNDWLNEAGYHFCKGKIMAGNPEWCQPLGTWKNNFSTWIASAEPQDLLDINIFFDFRPAWGEPELAEALHEHIHSEISHHPAFFIFMTGNIQRLKPPLNLFGNIQVGSSGSQPGTFDIKMAMLPVVDLARLYALREGIRETGTLARMLRLHQKGMLTEAEYNDRVETYKALMSIRFRHQVDQMLAGLPADNFIQPQKLTQLEQKLLKQIFGQITDFIAKAGQDFKGGATG
jgi:CBS domain-containing protein